MGAWKLAAAAAAAATAATAVVAALTLPSIANPPCSGFYAWFRVFDNKGGRRRSGEYAEQVRTAALCCAAGICKTCSCNSSRCSSTSLLAVHASCTPHAAHARAATCAAPAPTLSLVQSAAAAHVCASPCPPPAQYTHASDSVANVEAAQLSVSAHC